MSSLFVLTCRHFSSASEDAEKRGPDVLLYFLAGSRLAMSLELYERTDHLCIPSSLNCNVLALTQSEAASEGAEARVMIYRATRFGFLRTVI